MTCNSCEQKKKNCNCNSDPVIKQTYDNCGPVYPITHIDAVIDDTNKNLTSILNDLKADIQAALDKFKVDEDSELKQQLEKLKESVYTINQVQDLYVSKSDLNARLEQYAKLTDGRGGGSVDLSAVNADIQRLNDALKALEGRIAKLEGINHARAFRFVDYDGLQKALADGAVGYYVLSMSIFDVATGDGDLNESKTMYTNADGNRINLTAYMALSDKEKAGYTRSTTVYNYALTSDGNVNASDLQLLNDVILGSRQEADIPSGKLAQLKALYGDKITTTHTAALVNHIIEGRENVSEQLIHITGVNKQAPVDFQDDCVYIDISSGDLYRFDAKYLLLVKKTYSVAEADTRFMRSGSISINGTTYNSLEQALSSFATTLNTMQEESRTRDTEMAAQAKAYTVQKMPTKQLYSQVLSPATKPDGNYIISDWDKFDLNGDGVINTDDVKLLINVVLDDTIKDKSAYDIDGDGSVDITDVTKVVDAMLSANGEEKDDISAAVVYSVANNKVTAYPLSKGDILCNADGSEISTVVGPYNKGIQTTVYQKVSE